MVKRCLSGRVLRRDSEYWVCSCRHWQWIPCKVAASSSTESNPKRESRNTNVPDGKLPRGPLLSDWVGKVLGQPSVQSPGDCNDPVATLIDMDDDAAEASVHLQTSVLSGLVAQLETELSAA